MIIRRRLNIIYFPRFHGIVGLVIDKTDFRIARNQGTFHKIHRGFMMGGSFYIHPFSADFERANGVGEQDTASLPRIIWAYDLVFDIGQYDIDPGRCVALRVRIHMNGVGNSLLDFAIDIFDDGENPGSKHFGV